MLIMGERGAAAMENEARKRESARLYGALETAVNGSMARLFNALEQLQTELETSGNDELLERAQGLLEVIRDCSLEQGRLTMSLGESMLCQSGKLVAQEMSMDVSGHLEQMTEMARPYAERKGCTLEFVSDGELVTVVDPTLMDRMVLNLISNALWHGRENGHILVQLHREGSGGCLSVTDDGFGIPKERQEHLTELFGDWDERFPGGTGLYLVKEFCDRMNWTLEWESGPQGTRFAVHIPPVAPQDILRMNSSSGYRMDEEVLRSRVRMEMLGSLNGEHKN